VHRVQVRTIAEDTTLPRIVRRSGGSSLTRRPAQMVPLSAQGRDAVTIAEVASTGRDRVRDVLRDVNANGFDSLQPTCRCGPAAQGTLTQSARRERRPHRTDRGPQRGCLSCGCEPGPCAAGPTLPRVVAVARHRVATGHGGQPTDSRSRRRSPGGPRSWRPSFRRRPRRAHRRPAPRPDPSMTHFIARRRDDRGVGRMHHRRSRAARWRVAPAGAVRARSHDHAA